MFVDLKKLKCFFIFYQKAFPSYSHQHQPQNALFRSQQHLVRVLRDNHRLPVLLRLHHPLLRRNLRHQHLQT